MYTTQLLIRDIGTLELTKPPFKHDGVQAYAEIVIGTKPHMVETALYWLEGSTRAERDSQTLKAIVDLTKQLLEFGCSVSQIQRAWMAVDYAKGVAARIADERVFGKANKRKEGNKKR